MLTPTMQLMVGALSVLFGAGILLFQRRARTCEQHSHRVGIVATLLGIGLLLGGAVLLVMTALPKTTEAVTDNPSSSANFQEKASSQTPPADSALAPQPSADQDPDAEARRLVVGTWTDNYQGKRTMTLKEDGTGTMIVELSGMKARLFASRLFFEMVWSLEDGRLKKRTLRGEPAGRVALILKTMGDRVDEPILDLTDQQLVLLDKDGETRYTWTRVTDADAATESEK